MSNGTSIITKRIALAFSGLVYIFGAPYVVAEGLPFIALWAIVGFGLVRQMILAIAPSGFQPAFPWPTLRWQKRSTEGTCVVPSIAVPEAV